MSFPALGGHQHWDEEAGSSRYYCCHLPVFQQFLKPADYSEHAEANPDSEGVERAGIRVIALTGLVWGLVQIHDDSDSRHEEKQEHHPAVLRVVLQLVEKAYQAQQQRQEIIFGMSGVLHGPWQVVLVAETRVVNEAEAADPITVLYFPLTLNIILATDEIPHKVTPIHPAALVIEEKP